ESRLSSRFLTAEVLFALAPANMRSDIAESPVKPTAGTTVGRAPRAGKACVKLAAMTSSKLDDDHLSHARSRQKAPGSLAVQGLRQIRNRRLVTSRDGSFAFAKQSRPAEDVPESVIHPDTDGLDPLLHVEEVDLVRVVERRKGRVFVAEIIMIPFHKSTPARRECPLGAHTDGPAGAILVSDRERCRMLVAIVGEGDAAFEIE